MTYSAPALHFVEEAAQFCFDIRARRGWRRRDGEVGGGADGVGADVQAVVQPADDVDQTDGVHVKAAVASGSVPSLCGSR